MNYLFFDVTEESFLNNLDRVEETFVYSFKNGNYLVAHVQSGFDNLLPEDIEEGCVAYLDIESRMYNHLPSHVELSDFEGWEIGGEWLLNQEEFGGKMDWEYVCKNILEYTDQNVDISEVKSVTVRHGFEFDERQYLGEGLTSEGTYKLWNYVEEPDFFHVEFNTKFGCIKEDLNFDTYPTERLLENYIVDKVADIAINTEHLEDIGIEDAGIEDDSFSDGSWDFDMYDDEYDR